MSDNITKNIDNFYSELEKWLAKGICDKCKYVIIVHHLFSNEIFSPVFIKTDDELNLNKSQIEASDNNTIFSIYDLTNATDEIKLMAELLNKND